MSTIDHEIGHTLVAASLPDGSPAEISCNPGTDKDGQPYNGICGASATSALSSAMVWAGGMAGEKVFAGVDRVLPEDSDDYKFWQSKSQEAGIDPEEAYRAACELLDTPANHAAHKSLKEALEANNGELSAIQVRSIINQAYDQNPEPLPLVGANAGNSRSRRKKKPTIADRINNWLYENPGQLFRDGKWRFWFVAEFGLQLLIALVAFLLFPKDTGIIILLASTIILWLVIGFLHYTDTQDKKLDRGVSLFDSGRLFLAAMHFCYILWVFGHYSILKHSEADYDQKRQAWNQEVDRDRDRKLKQTELEVARETKREKIARYEADIAYRASLSGQRVRMKPQAQQSGSEEEAKLETKDKPKAFTGQTSQEYLTERDGRVRLWHLAEILLAIATLIFIRNRSVSANHALRVQPANPWRQPKN